MWEVDPETRSKLHQIQKKEGSGNDRCCDCGAPSPQWASPKFSTFICLSCAGTHRGLGVHISFVRSISMDAFKQNEMLRMQHGGNKAWQDFYNSNNMGSGASTSTSTSSENGGKSFQDSSIQERYEGDIGDEWKERLSAKVQDKDFDRDTWQREREAYKAKIAANANSRSQTPVGNGLRKGGAAGILPTTTTTNNNRSESPSATLPATQKEKNESFFSTLGATNATRPENLPPSQGGRYAGFGSSSQPPTNDDDDDDGGGGGSTTTTLPPRSEFQTDPLTSLTKSLGWFTTSLTRTAKTVHESYIQPTAKNIAASDLAAQARAAAAQAGEGLQSAGQRMGRLVVEGPAAAAQEGRSAGAAAGGRGRGAAAAEPERKDFWDGFGAGSAGAGAGAGPEVRVVAAKATKAKPSSSTTSIGTAAMKNLKGDLGLRLPPGSAGKGDGKDEGWEEW